ncbi:hypothetical protein BpHYR1_040974 [Brachionus plicatilis]|uniref:BED-type domain-containing protein n=1 Tax=Brachionus plicatilis TaxID=10195 RepID=A0A3M7SED0_BRAPC|nr:hypothetical protein BpHYR1_040974 [Brachionus plicatilis]
MSELADQDQTITTPSVLLDSANMSNQETPHEKSTEPKTPTAKTLLPLILNCYNYNVDNLNSPDNMVSCKGCSKNITYKLGYPTSNLSRHIKNSNSHILKHEELLKEICQKPSPVRSAKRKLSEIEPNPNFSPLKSIKNFEEYRPSDAKKISHYQ